MVVSISTVIIACCVEDRRTGGQNRCRQTPWEWQHSWAEVGDAERGTRHLVFSWAGVQHDVVHDFGRGHHGLHGQRGRDDQVHIISNRAYTARKSTPPRSNVH